MTKELFVSSTPHETKVGMVEDDQLAEVYLERENEYTLAGSIYKGRVTRVLPGMQSAFVDIGLERDAFLYVSDFMELHDEDDVEEVPATNSQAQTYEPQAEAQPTAEVPQPVTEESSAVSIPPSEDRPNNRERSNNGGEQREGRNDWRNNRRRRGRGRRAERSSESRHTRPEAPRSEHESYGPPPGYTPIVLPGESISKYQRIAQTQPPHNAAQSVTESATPVFEAFPEDEPLFTRPSDGASERTRLQTTSEVQGRAGSFEDQHTVHEEDTDDHSNREHRLEQMNVATVFGGDALEEASSAVAHEEHTTASAPSPGTLEEEEIEEEEADIASYVEDLEEDAAFDEMEEETQHAADFQKQEIAASAEPHEEAPAPFSAEQVAPTIAEVSETEEGADSEEDDEAELEQAQAEAEALLDAEARGNGTVDARAEVRGPSSTAAYTQRTQRPSFDRQRGPRGRRGGRRFRRHEPQQLPQITDLLKEGQEILVQIAKEPIAKKGARITSHIALPGRFLVYMPTVHHTGVSRKISSEEERQRLKRIILSERENGHGGFIVRTAAQGASEDELRADIRFLKGLWSEIKTRAEMSKAPALIYHDLNVVERVLRDQVTSDFSQIWVDTEQEYERILRFANRFQPALVKRVKLYTKETPLFEQFGLNDEINKALKSKVWLKSGGYIVINQTEALVAIDVNTGKYVGKTARLEDTIVKTNVDAIKEIVRQIRLRDLGGIIIIDFIDMDERRNRQKVMQALEEALRSDRSPSKVLQFNDFGLVAITRKRVKQSLERTIGSPCPYCQATGFVKSVTTVCNEVYLEMRKMVSHLEHSDVMLRVNPEVAKVLKANNGRLLTEMEELTKKTVIVKSDPALHQEQFDIN
ncbi:MAG TPA: Rne/Rng family ribonuclease [Terriglobales bacterium]|nr:Rne/Rng family ribonuclease [Terriglobales bacterium]